VQAEEKGEIIFVRRKTIRAAYRRRGKKKKVDKIFAAGKKKERRGRPTIILTKKGTPNGLKLQEVGKKRKGKR